MDSPAGTAQFTTMWTDAPDAMDILDASFEAGVITEAEQRDLAFFIEHGWLIWRNAIPDALIDRFAADIHNHHRSPGMFPVTDHRHGSQSVKLSGGVPDRFESLFDLYVNLRSSREVCLFPRIARFLSIIFEARPLAFQQLLFQRSNEHKLHQDTSVVAVEEPMLLAATWIALEDVVEGSGELAFYDASHRIPHYLFKGGTKRFNPDVDDRSVYCASLAEACRDLRYERFMARKGDVFFWTADLVHLSHPRTLPEETSRLSCVTHYCPDTTTPFWFRRRPDKRGIEPHGDIGCFASRYYVLPTHGEMLRPSLPK